MTDKKGSGGGSTSGGNKGGTPSGGTPAGGTKSGGTTYGGYRESTTRSPNAGNVPTNSGGPRSPSGGTGGKK